MNVHKEIGKKIRALRIGRAARPITLEIIAVKAGISVSFLSMIERGARAPGIDTLARLASALHVPLAELFRFDSDPEQIDPLYRPIIDLCRDRAMTAADVERVVAIVKAAID